MSNRRKANKPTREQREGARRDPLVADPELFRRRIRLRMIVVAIGLGVGMLIATGRTVMLQTKEASYLKEEAAANYVRSRPLDDWRGDITDRNGALLAVTVHRWAVTADPQIVKDSVRTGVILADLLGGEAADYADKLAPTFRRADEASANPAARAARRAVMPAARIVADIFEYPVERTESRLRVLEYFFQMEQLQVPGIYKVAQTLSDAADAAASAINSDTERLRFFPTRGRRFAYIARDLDDEKARRVADAKRRLDTYCTEQRREGRQCDNPLRAVRVAPEPRRYYPKRELATQLLGLVGPDSHGISGAELALDGLLAGGQVRTRAVRDRHGRSMYLEGLPDNAQFEGHTVVLSIDEKAQAIAEHELTQACLVSGARAGYAVVYRVKTGEVLAAANFPGYNPNNYKQWFKDRQPLGDERRAFGQAREDLEWAAEWPLNRRAFPGREEEVLLEERKALNRAMDAFIELQHHYPDASRANAFLDVYEPGSIMKVFTIAAGLEEGVATLDRIYDLENGTLEINDVDENTVTDTSRHENGDLALIMKKSSNIGAAKIGFDLGAQRLERYLRAFGFGEPTSSGFPGEAGGLLFPAAEWKVVHLANIAFGQGLAATGIQLASALGAIGNGGQLMRPLLVRAVLDSEGHIVKEWEPEVVRQVISPQTASTVIDLMKGVIEPGGTGARAYIPEYPVAGKTGTGQKSHLRKRGYAEDMWVSTFFGVAPADNPELAVVVLVDEPKGKRHGGGLFAAPAFRQIMRRTLAYLGVPSPFEAGRQVAWLDPQELKRRRALEEDVDPMVHALSQAAPPVDKTAASDVPVPNFRGLTMDRVRQLANDVGLKVNYVGTGVARTQDTPAHDRVPIWSTVTVTFQPRAPGYKSHPTTAGAATGAAGEGGAP